MLRLYVRFRPSATNLTNEETADVEKIRWGRWMSRRLARGVRGLRRTSLRRVSVVCPPRRKAPRRGRPPHDVPYWPTLLRGQNEKMRRSSASKLGKRASSVFSAPSRAAANAVTYEKANAANRRDLSMGLSKQAFGICRKIREVDQALVERPSLVEQILEIHPEVCFWALNGGEPMHYRKSRSEGYGERMAVLERHERRSESWSKRR